MDFKGNSKLQIMGSVSKQDHRTLARALECAGVDIFPFQTTEEYLLGNQQSYIDLIGPTYMELQTGLLSLLIDMRLSWVLAWERTNEVPFGTLTFSAGTGKLAILSNIGDELKINQLENVYKYRCQGAVHDQDAAHENAPQIKAVRHA